jgi:Lamin Tail Domain/PHP domain
MTASRFACALLIGIVAVSIDGRAKAQDNVYFGNLHSHTVYSDGSGTPDEAFAAAEAAGLDFIAVTEHSHAEAEGSGDTQRIHIARDRSLYNGARPDSLISAARRHTVSGRFVAIYGQEYSSIAKGNHVNVFEVPEVIDVPNTKFRDLIDWTARHPDSQGRPALLQLNHPALADEEALEYGKDDFGTPEAWLRAMDAQAELIEVFNGPAKAKQGGVRSAAVQESDYYYYLNLGFHLAPSVGHDNHYRTWGIVTDARVAVIAPGLTKEAVLGALRARHAYATSDKNLKLVLRSGAALQGDILASLPAAGSDLPLTLSIKDDDEPNASYQIDVFSDLPGGDPINGRRPVNSYPVSGNTSAPIVLDGVPFERAGQYVVVRVKQLRGSGEDEGDEPDSAWTAPIWFGGVVSAPVTGPLPPAAAPSLRLTKVLPDPPGSDLRDERVWLKNETDAAIDLAGWVLADLAGNLWRLQGTLPAGEERALVRNGEALSLNNGGDQLELRNPAGTVVQTVTYGPARPGQEVPLR